MDWSKKLERQLLIFRWLSYWDFRLVNLTRLLRNKPFLSCVRARVFFCFRLVICCVRSASGLRKINGWLNSETTFPLLLVQILSEDWARVGYNYITIRLVVCLLFVWMIFDVFVLFRGGSVVFISSIAGYQPMQVMIITTENNTRS